MLREKPSVHSSSHWPLRVVREGVISWSVPSESEPKRIPLCVSYAALSCGKRDRRHGMYRAIWMIAALAGCAGAPAREAPATDVLVPSAPVLTGEGNPSATPEAGEAMQVRAAKPVDGVSLGPLDRARVESTRAATQQIGAAVALWRSDHGDACPRFDDLVRDQVIAPNTSAKDPWGTPYDIECTGKGARVRSAGPDTRRETPDDVLASAP